MQLCTSYNHWFALLCVVPYTKEVTSNGRQDGGLNTLKMKGTIIETLNKGLKQKPQLISDLGFMLQRYGLICHVAAALLMVYQMA
ncbi:hypothetical protein RchiOBHm_Chr1g0313721 [Rosa chinensis]|uniref:Uncharacterized protein n=1 Tax=Rosa chinensis TaxID=74649 RepID=A0A2P6S6Y2_ROSCH|nr:hypothetical protein RchiOBHm_Chr1g0313721 [Rosa chinensis]